MNWAIGQGSSGGRLAWSSRLYVRTRTRTSSLLQSQKLVSSSRSSSGVSRSDEKVVRDESATLADCPDRLRLAVFIAAFLNGLCASSGSWMVTGLAAGSYNSSWFRLLEGVTQPAARVGS